jgi:quercetin dioxygenase-like cupin family protein
MRRSALGRSTIQFSQWRDSIGHTHKEADMRQVLLMAAVLVMSAVPTYAQDAVKVDPKHYKVEFENDQVRVLRITYGPGEKSVMHEHPANVAVFLNDIQARFTQPDGKSQDVSAKAGTSQWNAGGKHLPENVGDKRFELILVELKSKPATSE